MGRQRQNNLGLPPRMQKKGNAFYYVASTTPRKWLPLGNDLAKARVRWAQLENGDNVDSRMFCTRLDEYLVSPKFEKLAEKTRKQYENVAKALREYFKGAAMSNIAPAHVALWMDDHPSQIQANTGKAIISNVFAVAVRHGIVDRNPATEIKYHQIAGRDRLITDDEFLLIWGKAQPHVQIAMDIGYLTGTRIQDILDIKLQDITDEGLHIRQGKTKKKMVFLMSPALEDAIAKARALPRPIRGMHLLCNRRGQPYSYRTFNDHWLEAVRAVGVEGIHFHDIRAKAATDAEDMGLDYQALLGHTTKAMSDKYLRVKRIAKVPALHAGVKSST